jgi:hypothetical protein
MLRFYKLISNPIDAITYLTIYAVYTASPRTVENTECAGSKVSDTVCQRESFIK